MAAFTMDLVQEKLRQIEAGFQIVLEELDNDLLAASRSGDDAVNFNLACMFRRTSEIYSPALSLIHESIQDLKGRVDEAAE